MSSPAQAPAPPTSDKVIQFFGHPICPFAHRAWAALLYSMPEDVELDYVHVELQASKPAWYAAEIYDKATVPVIRLSSGAVIPESDVIEFFAADSFPEAGLLPTDPVLRAQVRVFMGAFGGMIPQFYQFLREQDPSTGPEHAEKLLNSLEGVNKLLVAQGNEGLFLGDQFTLAETHCIPFLNRFQTTLKYFREFDLFAELRKRGCDRMLEWYDAAVALDCFEKTIQPPQFYVDLYGPAYAKEPWGKNPKL